VLHKPKLKIEMYVISMNWIALMII